jgi:hypothetical protein
MPPSTSTLRRSRSRPLRRAIDRGLAALLVSLVRLAGPEFNGNKGAARITREHPYVQAALAAITKRVEEINVRARESVAADLQACLDDWLAAAMNTAGPQALGYRSENDGITMGLLAKAGLGAWQRFTVLNSLRDVEPSVGLVLDEGGLDEVNDWSVPAPVRAEETS